MRFTKNVPVKYLSLLLLFVIHFFDASAACVTCYSVKDAMENPASVRQLILRNKGLTEFPQEILSMSSLVYLDLSQNNIIAFPEANESNPLLTHLVLSKNRGLNTHSLFSYTANKKLLEFLDLSDCSVGQLSYRIGDHPALMELHLPGNKLQTLPGEIGKLSKLNYLNLSRNQLAHIPYLLSELHKLKSLDISENLIENHEGIFTSLRANNTLKELSVSLETPNLQLAASLQYLPIESLRIVGSFFKMLPPSILRLKRLNKLIFERCDFDPRMQSTMDWGGLKNLDAFELISCNSLPNLKNLTEVGSVKVFGTNVIPPDSFCNMRKIGELNLSGQPIELEGLEKLQSCLPETKILHASLRDHQKVASTQREVIKSVESNNYVMESSSTMMIQTDQMLLDIPARAFQTANGQMYDGKVHLKLKELFDPVSMFLEQIPMTFDNNGEEEVFGSNGMFEFRAFDEAGNELFPNPDAIIQVTLADQQPDNKGELFYLNDTSNQWQRAQPSNNLTVLNFDSLRVAILDSLQRLPDSRFVDIPVVPIYIYFKPAVKSSSPTELSFFAGKPKKSYRTNKALSVGMWQRASNLDQYYITQQVWKLDTTVSDDMRKYLYEVRKTQKRMSKRNMKKVWMYGNMPRPIKNLEITPDFERDCFMMSFSYFDTTLVFPVYLESKNNSKDLAKEQQRFYATYLKLKQAEVRNARRLEAQRRLSERTYADQMRASLAMSLAMQEVQFASNFMGSNGLQFGLMGFGVVNCDYFSRNPVTEVVSLHGELEDTDGSKLAMPRAVSILMLNTNSTLSYGPKNIPISQRDRTLIAFHSDDKRKLHVGKIKRVMGGFADLLITTVVIDGLTSRQIKERVLRAAE